MLFFFNLNQELVQTRHFSLSPISAQKSASSLEYSLEEFGGVLVWANWNFRSWDAHVASFGAGRALVCSLVGHTDVVEEGSSDSVLDDVVVDSISNNPGDVCVVGGSCDGHLVFERVALGAIVAASDACFLGVGDFGLGGAVIDGSRVFGSIGGVINFHAVGVVEASDQIRDVVIGACLNLIVNTLLGTVLA